METNQKQSQKVTGWVGWVYFAGLLMMLAGVFQAIAGLVGIFNDAFYLVGEDSLLVFDYMTWGWIHLIFGIVLFISALSVMKGGVWGRTVGIILALFSAIANFAFIQAYPWWSLIIIALDFVVIYALAAHGNEARE